MQHLYQSYQILSCRLQFQPALITITCACKVHLGLITSVWEKPHQENLTGTPLAYAPAGSIRRPAPVERRDYEAWQPE